MPAQYLSRQRGRQKYLEPVHSVRCKYLADLATYSRIQATTALNEKYVFILHTRPTPIQQRAFEVVPYVPTGMWEQQTAYHKNLKGLLQAPAYLMWNVEKV